MRAGAARCPSACDVKPLLGSIVRSPGSQPGITLLTSPLRGPSGFAFENPSSAGALATTTAAATASIAHPSGGNRCRVASAAGFAYRGEVRAVVRRAESPAGLTFGGAGGG